MFSSCTRNQTTTLLLTVRKSVTTAVVAEAPSALSSPLLQLQLQLQSRLQPPSGAATNTNNSTILFVRRLHVQLPIHVNYLHLNLKNLNQYSVRHFSLGNLHRKFVLALEEYHKIDNVFAMNSHAPIEVKVAQVIKSIENEPTLLYQLHFLFYELSRLGITHDHVEQRRRTWKFWPLMLFNVIPLNSAFWKEMYWLEYAHRTHHLNPWKLYDLGLLDPKNFPKDFIEQLKSGSYNGHNIKDQTLFAMSRPKFDPELESKETVKREEKEEIINNKK